VKLIELNAMKANAPKSHLVSHILSLMRDWRDNAFTKFGFCLRKNFSSHLKNGHFKAVRKSIEKRKIQTGKAFLIYC